MGELTKVIMTNMQDLERLMPEKASIEKLEHYSDIVLLKGMHKMENIMDTDEYQTEGGKEITIYPADKIKAMNSLVNLGRLIDSRRARQVKKVDEMEIPDDLRIE